MNEDIFNRLDELMEGYPDETLAWIRRGCPNDACLFGGPCEGPCERDRPICPVCGEVVVMKAEPHSIEDDGVYHMRCRKRRRLADVDCPETRGRGV